MRSLAGSRYDLVERNNGIVLEYRKKEVIRLHTVDLVTGRPGEQKSMGVSVTSTYGLSRIDWDAQALNAAGGKIVLNGADYAVVLPPYQSSAPAVNTYTISGVAVDKKGNRSDRSDTQVTVLAPEVNKQTSTFTPVSSVLPADGKSSQALTLTLRDENNQAVDIDLKDISLKSSTLKSAAVSALTRKSAGICTVTVTAGTDVENVTLTPIVGGTPLSSAVVTINSATPDAGQSVFTASPETIVADNAATSTLTLIVKDAQGNALTGLKDSLAFTIKDSIVKVPAAGTLTESAITESGTVGTYTATLQGGTAGKYTIVPEYNGTAMGSLSATVTLMDTTPDEKTSTIETDSTTYFAGTDMLIRVTLKDASGKPVTGAQDLLTAQAVTVPNATLKSGSSWTDNGGGEYTATYTATTPGAGLKATLTLTGWNESAESGSYTIEEVVLEGVEVNGHIFKQNAGFPTTGFKGAGFTLLPSVGNPGDYTWRSDTNWASVQDGDVVFTGEGTKNRVTITGTLKSDPNQTVTYSFALKSWYYHPVNQDLRGWEAANRVCNIVGDTLPAVQQFNGSTNHSDGVRGTIDGLWSEWGSLQYYKNAGFGGNQYWLSEKVGDDDDSHFVTSASDGTIHSSRDNDTAHVLCRQAL